MADAQENRIQWKPILIWSVPSILIIAMAVFFIVQTLEIMEEETESTTVSQDLEVPAREEVATEPPPPEAAPAEPPAGVNAVGTGADSGTEIIPLNAESKPTKSTEKKKGKDNKKDSHKLAEVEAAAEKLGKSTKITGKGAAPLSYLIEKGEQGLALNRSADSAAWQVMLLQVNHRLNVLTRGEEGGKWEVRQADSNSEHMLRLQFRQESTADKDPVVRKKQGQYSVQMMSLEPERFEKAVNFVKTMVKDGYYAYIFRSEEKVKGKYWFRVRVGFTATSEEAQSLGEEIYFRYRDQLQLPKNYFATIPVPEELNRDLLNLRNLKNSPWTVESPETTQHEQALRWMAHAAENQTFAYLAYQKSSASAKTQYRLRIGRFASQEEAAQELNKLIAALPELAKARVAQF